MKKEARQKREGRTAWQPFTPGGVACFAEASILKVLTYQFFFAVLNALTLAWFLQTSWMPVMRSGVKNLPATGEISRGLLHWRGPSPLLLAYNSDLALLVDLEHTGKARVPSDLLVEFSQRDFRIFSLLGFIEVEYPAGWRIAFNRAETGPWFGAWGPPILWLAVLFSVIFLLAGWALLAAAYSGIAWLVAYFANRSANMGQTWRLGGAALMPASLVLWLGIAMYGAGALHLPGFLMMVLGHLVAGWIYVLLAPLALARDTTAPKKGNPFTG